MKYTITRIIAWPKDLCFWAFHKLFPAIRKRRIALWLRALRSGEYTQAVATMRIFYGPSMLGELDPNPEFIGHNVAYCCLGVACEIFRLQTGKGYWDGGSFVVNGVKMGTILPPAVRRWYGFVSGNPKLAGHYATHHNDVLLHDFQQIADAAEQSCL